MEAIFKIVDAQTADKPPGRVYLDYYQLSEAPFAITPDPEFLFSSSCHQQVLDKISYAINGRMGFVLLTGEVGTGKTTLCRALLDRLGGQSETVYVINPSISGQELIASIIEDLGPPPEPQATKKALIDQLNQRLLSGSTDRPFVVIIDDAQTMTPETLEDLRLLSNLETDKRKLIQVVLSGQPELLDMLATDRLRQLKQRIAIHCRLDPLPSMETGGYISRRLFVAGNKGQVNFSPAATRLIHKTSGGIPRLINKICDFALTAGYVKDAQAINPSHVKRALAELDDLDCRRSWKGIHTLRYGFPAAMAVVLLAVVFILHPGTLPPEASVHRDPVGINDPVEAPPAPAKGDPVAVRPAARAETEKVSPPAIAEKKTPGIITETDNPALRSEDSRQQPDLSPATYALQLASFRTRENAIRGAAQYRKKGVPAHWQVVGNGQWHRVVAGKFENHSQAARYRRTHGLKTAIIIKALLTVRVLPRRPDLSNTDICKVLSEIGYDSLMERGQSGDNETYTGLFLSIEDAAITAERINASGRLLAQVVSR